MRNSNQNKAGYKHTPLGWIPEDWDVSELIDLCINSKRAIVDGPFGSNLKSEHFRKSGIPVINSSFVTDLTFNASEYVYVDEELFLREIRSKAVPGDIIMAKIGARCGSSAILPYNHPISIISGNSLKISIDEEKNNTKYIWYNLIYEYQKNQFKDYKSIGAQPAISTPLLKKMRVRRPVKLVQDKIATILSTWDEAVTKTQQLISQLQHRNKGLIQQLLSGKKRLKGFENTDWKRLHATEIFKGVSVKNNGTERLLSATQDKGIIPRDMLEARVTMPTGETGSFKLVEVGDFVISLRSFQGGIEYSEYRGLVSPAYTVLKPTMQISTSFFKHYFKSYDFIGHLAVTVIGIRDGKQVSYEDFSILKLPCPSLKEQEAIAKVVDAAVSEVKLQEQHLAALQQQKKGLMQKLLTGELRVKIDNHQN